MVTRAQVLAYRAAVSGLSGTGSVLLTGVQDHPTGATARLATALRGAADGDAVLVHSVRAATHLHRSGDLGLLAAALRVDDGAELAQQAIGRFGAEIGSGFGAAVDEVAAVMRDVMAGGVARTKGELSGAVSPRVDARLAPWCQGCGVHHVQDALFRYATLQTGLVIEVESPKVFRFRASGGGGAGADDVDAARAELVRRFVHAAGPVRPTHLATWLSLAPAAAKRWWALAEPDLTDVEADGRRGSILAADAPSFDDPPAPDELRLLGSYDPLTELADRELLVPDPAARRQVWAATANPGIVLWDGEIAGTWRRRTGRGRLTLTATAFDGLPPAWADHESVRADADVIGRFFGVEEVEVATAG
ncbi:DNA glycosylase AlkZ-like family protein [Jiangella alkaliphila]|uniref:Winged helix DNA-binding domain-containing protein n=1 Tax=Jiangella alkaliphila TaxID=419479 RepID=A0A1H2K536_9ACTN|nr:crosslink repair DNA glycosylase YcaQ family protein [Jiangella alkaliphila]SDU63672.1 Winged helix DNA-binding domain-containing protein [Jiangella alkaliphila]